MRRLDVPVLIVGGGCTGLSASIFLSDLGVRSVLVERHAGTSTLPKAHYLNQRTMEIFALHGVAEAVYAASAPRHNHGKITWMTSLGGDGPFDRRTIAEIDIMGGGGLRETYDAKGLTHPTHIPQLRLEPVLRAVAESRGADLLFRHEFESLEQDESGVRALVRNLETGELIEVHAQYLLAADGGRSVGNALGIEMQGMTGMADWMMAWFSADLSSYITDDRAVMRMFVHPERPQVGRFAGALVTMGPDRWDGHSDEWAAFWMTPPDDTDQVDPGNAAAAIQDFFKIDVPIEMRHVSHWTLETVIADRFAEGRVLLIGDAAHRQTPGAGLGLNSGIQDAHCLASKLALVLAGSGPELLDSYEAERRPVISRNVGWSLFSMSNMALPMLAMGISPVMPPEINQHEFAKLFDPGSEGVARRARLDEVFRTQRIEYAAHDMELGFCYASAAILDDGTEPARRDPMGAEYFPTTRPGSRLPHAWLDLDGVRRSTHELIPLGGFLLLTGPGGEPWCAAGLKAAAECGLVLSAVQVGDGEGIGTDARDPEGHWRDLREIDDDGVVLVRPDGHVAFRSRGRVDHPYDTLLAALRAITFR
jgi:2,4-dichlorophenol 6-monooxygenase